jgi:cation diffusion facilitator CzcD-associated flavoprotein CzcO
VRNFSLVLVAVLALAACRQDRADDQRTDTVTPETMEQARANWPAGLSEIIDSANAAYSARDYDRAATLYRQGADMAPNVTATWFGIYMTEHARGNIAAADSAMARAQALAPGASLIHGAPGDTALPAGHPTLPDTQRPPNHP